MATARRDWGDSDAPTGGFCVPPPRAPGTPGGGFGEGPEPGDRPATTRAARARGVRFEADLDASELDDRERPGPTWTARGRELSRAALTLRTRRMCYVGRLILVAVHLVDDQPAPLLGRVAVCEYDGDGMYRVELELLPVPERDAIRAWVEARGARHSRPGPVRPAA